MDLCRLKKSELDNKFQIKNGRVVLRGDVVKDDSGSCAVFPEQGSSASQMAAAKVLGVACYTTCMGWTSKRRNIRVYPNQNGGRFDTAGTSRVWFFWKRICTGLPCRSAERRHSSKRFWLKMDGIKNQPGNAFFCASPARSIPIRKRARHQNDWTTSRWLGRRAI